MKPEKHFQFLVNSTAKPCRNLSARHARGRINLRLAAVSESFPKGNLQITLPIFILNSFKSYLGIGGHLVPQQIP